MNPNKNNDEMELQDLGEKQYGTIENKHTDQKINTTYTNRFARL